MHPLGFRQKPCGNPVNELSALKKRLRQGFLHREQLRSSESFAKTAPWQLRSFCAESRYAAQKVLRRVCTLATQKFLHRSNSTAQRVLRRRCLGTSEVSAQRAATQLSRSCEESAEGAESHCAAQHVRRRGHATQKFLHREQLYSSESFAKTAPCQLRSSFAESTMSGQKFLRREYRVRSESPVQGLQRVQRATPQLSRFCAEGTIATQRCLRRSFCAEGTLSAQKFLR